MIAENFGISWLTVDLPFECEIHWIRPRAIPKANRFSVLITHTEPTPYGMPESELMEVANLFDLVVVKKNHLGLENAIEDCFGSAWITESPTEKEFSVTYLLSAGNHQGVLPGYLLRMEVLIAQSKVQNIKTKYYKSKYFEQHKEKIYRGLPEIGLPLLPNDEKKYLYNSMFNISIENHREINYFTEKLIDCFRTFTVPIYNGCLNVDDYFDMRGVIKFNTTEELVEILNALTPDEYFNRLDAISANFKLAEPYFDAWARLAKNIIQYKNKRMILSSCAVHKS